MTLQNSHHHSPLSPPPSLSANDMGNSDRKAPTATTMPPSTTIITTKQSPMLPSSSPSPSPAAATTPPKDQKSTSSQKQQQQQQNPQPHPSAYNLNSHFFPSYLSQQQQIKTPGASAPWRATSAAAAAAVKDQNDAHHHQRDMRHDNSNINQNNNDNDDDDDSILQQNPHHNDDGSSNHTMTLNSPRNPHHQQQQQPGADQASDFQSSINFSIKTVINQTWKSLILREKEKFGFNQDVTANSLSDKFNTQQKLSVLDKKIKQQYAFFRDFLDSDLANAFFVMIFVYLAGLLRVERCRLEMETGVEGRELMKQQSQEKLPHEKQQRRRKSSLPHAMSGHTATGSRQQQQQQQELETAMERRERRRRAPLLKRRFKDALAESKDHLSRLSFIYSQILSQYRFPHNLKKETLFYETLYLFSYKIVIAKFPKDPSLNSVIRDELASLFRTDIFHRSPHEKAQLKLFVKSETLCMMNHKGIVLPKPQLNVKLRDSKVRSPLMDHALRKPNVEKFNKIGKKNSRKVGSKRSPTKRTQSPNKERLSSTRRRHHRLNIPAYILFQNTAMENENSSSSASQSSLNFNEQVRARAEQNSFEAEYGGGGSDGTFAM